MPVKRAQRSGETAAGIQRDRRLGPRDATKTPKYWHDRADEMRGLAEGAPDAFSKRMMLGRRLRQAGGESRTPGTPSRRHTDNVASYPLTHVVVLHASP
jgi:hypothetical protein